MKNNALLLMALSLIAYAPVSQADLINIGVAHVQGNDYKLIYDQDTPEGSRVWLDYTNAQGTHAQQDAWVSSLNQVQYELNPGYEVSWSGGWQLPYGNTDNYFDNALQHLIGEELKVGDLGYGTGTGAGSNNYNPVTTEALNAGVFDNLKTGVYWTSGYFSFFNSGVGYSMGGYFSPKKDSTLGYGLAYRSAMVSTVPEPESYALFLAGLGLISFMARRRKTN